MAHRDDISVDWTISPRLITVAAPSTELVLQDLVDTLRELEASLLSLDDARLIDAFGKQELGGGVRVGITAQLYNAQVMFEPRTTPLVTGTCTQDNPAGDRLIDSSATFESDGIYPGCTVYNYSTKAMATVKEVVSETELYTLVLSGGSSHVWVSGDPYLVYPNVQCAITGGNLVAVDDNGNSIEPVLQSANVQVLLTTSSSATLQELRDIQFSSFNGGVTIDVSSPYSGTHYPVGTLRQPVNNTQDALAIAEEYGFGTFYVIGNITLDNGTDFSSYIFVGESPGQTVITVTSDADVERCEFSECTLTGILDGDCTVKNAIVRDVTYISGFVELCVLEGTVTLGGGATANFLDCWAGRDVGSPPVIDLGGSGQTLIMQNFNGHVKWVNKTGPEEANATLNAAVLEIDSTVTNGIGKVIGTGEIIDSSGPGFTLNVINVVSPGSIADAVWDEASSDHVDAGSVGVLLSNLGSMVTDVLKLTGNKVTMSGNVITIYEDDGTTVWRRYDLTGGGRVET